MNLNQDASTVGVLAYLGLLFAGIVIVLGVLQIGNQWGLIKATSTEGIPCQNQARAWMWFSCLFTLAAVIFLGAIFGRLCRLLWPTSSYWRSYCWAFAWPFIARSDQPGKQ